jgi:lipoate-protein ligase A
MKMMTVCDITLPLPEENLALDEALLDAAEAGEVAGNLRLYEPVSWFVVLGYGNRAETEANLAGCAAAGVPVLRRCSGGGTVLQGPGCLNYNLVLPIDLDPELGSIRGANLYIMERNAAALAEATGLPVQIQGHTDLGIGGLKFSGNAQRRKKSYLVFHGAILLNLDLARIEELLPMPSLQPEYRAGRRHKDFLMNLQISPERVKMALAKVWQAEQTLQELPLTRMRQLVEEKYGRREWNLSR